MKPKKSCLPATVPPPISAQTHTHHTPRSTMARTTTSTRYLFTQGHDITDHPGESCATVRAERWTRPNNIMWRRFHACLPSPPRTHVLSSRQSSHTALPRKPHLARGCAAPTRRLHRTPRSPIHVHANEVESLMLHQPCTHAAIEVLLCAVLSACGWREYTDHNGPLALEAVDSPPRLSGHLHPQGAVGRLSGQALRS